MSPRLCCHGSTVVCTPAARLDVQPPLGPLVYQWKDGRAAVELLGWSPHALVYGLSILLVSQDDGDPGTLHLVHLGMV